MSSSNIAPAKKMTFSVAITTENYRNMINNTLKEPGRANRFIAAITSAVATTPALQTCDPSSILAGGLLGEALNLSPSPQLGQYYLVPFKQKAKYDREGHLLSPECSKAQFVLGYKGYVQLALRSGQYSDLDCMEIRQGEYLGKDPQTGKPQFKFIEDDDLREKLPIVGYMAYFEYLNGFRKCIYWSREKMLNHADTYSQAFSKDAYRKQGNSCTTYCMIRCFPATGEFELLTDRKYLTSDAYLRRGDILVSSGHTVMALENGEKEDDMDKETFTELFREMRKDLQDNDCSDWSEAARQWAVNNGIVQGGAPLPDGSANFMWQDMMTREQLVTVLYRFAQKLGMI